MNILTFNSITTVYDILYDYTPLRTRQYIILAPHRRYFIILYSCVCVCVLSYTLSARYVRIHFHIKLNNNEMEKFGRTTLYRVILLSSNTSLLCWFFLTKFFISLFFVTIWSRKYILIVWHFWICWRFVSNLWLIANYLYCRQNRHDLNPYQYRMIGFFFVYNFNCWYFSMNIMASI
jgi:hypothetical protein